VTSGETGTLRRERRLIDEEGLLGTVRVLAVHQRHDWTGRIVTLLDAEGLGETKVGFKRRPFTYYVEGVTSSDISGGSWLLGPRGDLASILSTKIVGPWGHGDEESRRVKLRVRFQGHGVIRINEEWYVFSRRPLTKRILAEWEQRMTEGAQQYYHQVLPTVIDKLLHHPSVPISSEQIERIREVQEQILCRAVRLAEAMEANELSSTHLIQATKNVFKRFGRSRPHGKL